MIDIFLFCMILIVFFIISRKETNADSLRWKTSWAPLSFYYWKCSPSKNVQKYRTKIISRNYEEQVYGKEYFLLIMFQIIFNSLIDKVRSFLLWPMANSIEKDLLEICYKILRSFSRINTYCFICCSKDTTGTSGIFAFMYLVTSGYWNEHR